MPHYHKILNNKIEKLTKKLARFGLPKAFSPVQLSKNREKGPKSVTGQEHRVSLPFLMATYIIIIMDWRALGSKSSSTSGINQKVKARDFITCLRTRV
jgi:hypothetical protein